MFLFIYAVAGLGDWGIVFKYISCSYLSKIMGRKRSQKIYLNTSHVLIYPNVESYFQLGKDLNTSHVLIYRITEGDMELKQALFKYISCSYLSNV